MKFKDLGGKEHNKDIGKFKYDSNTKFASKSEQRLGHLLREIFPNTTIFSQVPCFGTRLRLDFFIPSLKIAFEFDGKQHGEFSQFFHGGPINFAKSQLNDIKKDQWCNNNNIILIRVENKHLGNLQEVIYEATRRN